MGLVRGTNERFESIGRYYDPSRTVIVGTLFRRDDGTWVVCGVHMFAPQRADGEWDAAHESYHPTAEVIGTNVEFTGAHKQKGPSTLGRYMVSCRATIQGRAFKARGFVGEMMRFYPVK